MLSAGFSRFWLAGALVGAAAASGCTRDFPLGAWDDLKDDAGTGGGAGIAGNAGSSAGAGMPGGPQPACLEAKEPGPNNARGAEIGATHTYTDWSFPGAVDAMEWELTIEADYTPSGSGYYYAYLFMFTEGLAGYFGLQGGGGYQSDPPSPTYDWTKMAVFWIAAPAPIRAELGDIAYPDARTYLQVQEDTTSWWTIHARYDWQVCHTYRLRIGRESLDASGDVWFGAWVRDQTTEVETFIGRMLLPTDWGQISPFVMQRTSRIERELIPPSSCLEPEPTSALFGMPTANGGTIGPTISTPNNRFLSPTRCPTSRFTNFPYAVRHEVGVSP